MTLAKITDHSERAVAHLLQQFRGKPRLERLVTAFIDEIQELEEMWFGVLVNRYLDNATGVQLDVIGRIVGRDRGALDDGRYRLVLRAWIRANRSEGTGNDCLDVISTALGAAHGLEFLPQYPAAFALRSLDFLAVDPGVLLELLAKARGGGVRALFEWFVSETSFEFSTTGTTESDAFRGFGDVSLPDVGGAFSSAAEAV